MNFIPMATEAELRDATSWVNTRYQWSRMLYADICRAIGEAIAAWSLVEIRLFAIYVVCVKSKEGDVVAALFEKLINFRTRLDIVNSCVRKSTVAKAHAKIWTLLYKQIRDAANRRNEIAHMTMFYDHVNESDDKKFFLSWSRHRERMERRLYTDDLVKTRDAFEKLGDDLASFWQMLTSADLRIETTAASPGNLGGAGSAEPAS